MSTSYDQYARKASFRGQSIDLPLLHEEPYAFVSHPYERLTSCTFLHASPEEGVANGVFLVTWLLPWDCLSELAFGAFRFLEEPRVASVTEEGVLLEGEVYGTCCLTLPEEPEFPACVQDKGREIGYHRCGTDIYEVSALLHEVETPAILHTSLSEDWEEEAVEMLQQEDDEALQEDFLLDWAPRRLIHPGNGEEYRLILRLHED